MDLTPSSFTDPKAALTALLAGHAIFTLVSRKSGARYTYKVEKADKPGQDGTFIYFASLLTGSDNTRDYSYIGILIPANKEPGARHTFRRTAKSALGADTAPVKALTWAIPHLHDSPDTTFAQMEVWHEGRCCKCGRPLTVPESIANAIGPDCAAKMGLTFTREPKAKAKPVAKPETTPVAVAAPEAKPSVTPEDSDAFNRRWAELKNQCGREEAEREQGVAMWKLNRDLAGIGRSL
jgi:hypothetical protein